MMLLKYSYVYISFITRFTCATIRVVFQNMSFLSVNKIPWHFPDFFQNFKIPWPFKHFFWEKQNSLTFPGSGKNISFPWLFQCRGHPEPPTRPYCPLKAPFPFTNVFYRLFYPFNAFKAVVWWQIVVNRVASYSVKGKFMRLWSYLFKGIVQILTLLEWELLLKTGLSLSQYKPVLFIKTWTE